MMEDVKPKMSSLQILALVAGIVAILGATVSWLVVIMVSSHYSPIDADTWPTYAITTAMWLVFSGAVGWLMLRLTRGYASARGWAIAGCFGAALSILSMFVFVD